MPQEYKTPGVYIEEIPHLPPSIASVETAIPAFIGYTQMAQKKEKDDLHNKPTRITSMLEYERYFGFAMPEKGTIKVTMTVIDKKIVDVQGKITVPAQASTPLPAFLMYYSMQMFFANGGGQCYIVSVNTYEAGTIMKADLKLGLDAIEKEREITLIVFPDSSKLSATDYYSLHGTDAIDQCVKLQNRFVVMDVWIDPTLSSDDKGNIETTLRTNGISGETDELKYAAVYYPRIYTNIDYLYDEASVEIISIGDILPKTLAELKGKNNAAYFMAKSAITNIEMLLPASSAVVGKYAYVDNARGVWKAPANVNIDYAIRPEILITEKDQEDLNVDTTAGKSINAIRSFPGRGPAIIWGARTLAGNDNEWRYVPVRRFFIMAEQSIKNATEQFVFYPNDRNTWVTVKAMIDNYLRQQWKAGALMGASPKEAYFIHVGLGETMTELDVWEGRMIVVIGMAVVRPAEFIILRFMHKMLDES